jgi:hypothetical protein
MAFVEHDDEIETFAAKRADDALGKGILPGSARGDEDLANAQALDAALEVSAVDGIAVAKQVAGRVSSGNAWTICWAAQAAVGWSVTPT